MLKSTTIGIPLTDTTRLQPRKPRACPACPQPEPKLPHVSQMTPGKEPKMETEQQKLETRHWKKKEKERKTLMQKPWASSFPTLQ